MLILSFFTNLKEQFIDFFTDVKLFFISIISSIHTFLNKFMSDDAIFITIICISAFITTVIFRYIVQKR